MLEVTGQYTSARIYSDDAEPGAVEQVKLLCDHPMFEDASVRVMPDVHQGTGCVIGLTVKTTKSFAIPNIIGVDIGCGVLAVRLEDWKVSFELLDTIVHKNIPSGFNIHQHAVHPEALVAEQAYREAARRTGQDESYVLRSMGTLGGGNHFCEVGEDELHRPWLLVHTGSRNFGLKIANFYQKRAEEQNPWGKGLAYLTDTSAEEYLEDMTIAQTFAAENRDRIVSRIVSAVGASVVERVESVHNYMAQYIRSDGVTERVVRKGAICAGEGAQVVIPWNMRDGSIIGAGIGNEEWNLSAPHGAGRKMGRKVAKKSLQMEDFQKSMEGIFSTCINEGTIDESPMAYKDHESVEAQLADTVKVLHRIKPLYNFKAGE